jgi:UDP-GlcNAc:undecaprenyl-phosphate GlcNAc-1-phosphate transferase
MGDTARCFLATYCRQASIIGLFKFYAVISFAVPFLVLGLPLFDAIFAIFRRLVNGKKSDGARHAAISITDL